MCIFTEFQITFIFIYSMYIFLGFEDYINLLYFEITFSLWIVTSYMKTETGNSRWLEHRSIKFFIIPNESPDPISPIKLSKYTVDFSNS